MNITRSIRTRYRFNSIFLKIVLFALVLTPSLNIFTGLPSLRIEDILLLGWLFFEFPLLRIRLSAESKLRSVFICIFFILLAASIFNGVFNGYGGSFSDFTQVIRFLKYLSVYLLSVYVFTNATRAELLTYIDYMLWLGFIVFILTLVQYFNFLGLNEIYIERIAPTQYKTLVGDHPNPRPVAMIGNPNELGYLFVAFSLLCLHALGSTAYKGDKAKYMFFLLFYFIGLMLTLSRTSLISYIVGVLSFSSWYFLTSKIMLKLKIIVLLLFSVTGVFYAINQDVFFEKYLWRFEGLANIMEDESFSNRVERWDENIEIIRKHPIVGVGPLRGEEFDYSADNEWLLIWRSYGFIGILIFIGLITVNIFFKSTVELKAFSLAIIFSIFVYIIPGAIFHSLVLFPFVLVLFAISDTTKNILR